MSKTIESIPLPLGLKHLGREETQPVHLGSAEVARLLEHWGFTRSGEDYLKKLVRCEVLHCKVFKHQRGRRFVTREVLAHYVSECGI